MLNEENINNFTNMGIMNSILTINNLSNNTYDLSGNLINNNNNNKRKIKDTSDENYKLRGSNKNKIINNYMDDKNNDNNKLLDMLTPNKLIIPNYKEFNTLNNKKYTLVNLKIICKHYKIKSSGTKQELFERIYKYLKETFYVCKIQKFVRNFFIKVLNNYKGPALIKRKLCVNDTDFMSMDSINDVNYYQFISYKDVDNYIYGFDIVSIYNWLCTSIKENKDIINPYNRNKLPYEFIKNLRVTIKLSKVLNFNINISIIDKDTERNISLEERLNNKIIELFQNMDQLGFYTDISWFNELNYYSLIKFMKELYDIWTYRAELTYQTKYLICQCYNPFTDYMYIITHNNIHSNYQIDINRVKSTILSIIDKMINSGSSREYKYLGASYVLAALTLVNSNAANSLPWLYHSVS